jgi:hypothetical protein
MSNLKKWVGENLTVDEIKLLADYEDLAFTQVIVSHTKMQNIFTHEVARNAFIKLISERELHVATKRVRRKLWQRYDEPYSTLWVIRYAIICAAKELDDATEVTI